MTHPLEKYAGVCMFNKELQTHMCIYPSVAFLCCIYHPLLLSPVSFSLTLAWSLSLHLPVSLFTFPGLPCLSPEPFLFSFLSLCPLWSLFPGIRCLRCQSRVHKYSSLPKQNTSSLKTKWFTPASVCSIAHMCPYYPIYPSKYEKVCKFNWTLCFVPAS